MTGIASAAIFGGGVIGASWAARLIENSVAVFDPEAEAEAERKIGAVLANADHAYSRLNQTRGPKGQLIFHLTIAESVASAAVSVSL